MVDPWNQIGNADDGRFYIIAKPVITRTGSSDITVFAFNEKLITNSQFLPVDPTAVPPRTIATDWTGPVTTSGAPAVNNMVIHYDPEANTLLPNATSTTAGLMEGVCSVAMAITITYEGPTLTNGGAIAAVQVPYASWSKEIAHNPNGIFAQNLVNWERVASLPGNYNGRISKGCYLYWRPTGEAHRLYYDVITDGNANTTVWNDETYPLLVISGQLDRATGGSFGRVRIMVDLVLQYTTTSRVVETIPRSIDCDEVAFADSVLRLLPQAMENAEHMDWIRRVLRGLGSAAMGFLMGGPVGAGLAGLASIGVSVPAAAPSYALQRRM